MTNKEKVKVFLVDDDDLLRDLLEMELLEQDDLTIETFATGESCIEHLGNKPDIIVLDYNLDGVVPTAKNGIQILKEIKIYNSDIVVIMLSGQSDTNLAKESLHHNAYDYVEKNATAPTLLKQMIRNIAGFKIQ